MTLPEKVRQDTEGYRAQVERFLAGELSPMAFRVYRVPMGVYEQRTTGTYMVRIRIGAGIVSSDQLKHIAGLSRTYGNGILHVTTRQDIQIHNVKIEQTSDVLEGLLEAGLSSRGGGGNTVRNVTACPRAGICPLEQFNVAPYALAVTEYLMQFYSSYNLPRKFKVVFSGCAQDCAYASVADLGFFAHVRDGARGFAVYGGGGLGSHPGVGIKLDDFVRADEVIEITEAVKRLFDQHGDRSNKHRARLRYVLTRMGPEAFARLYRQEREKVRQEGLQGCVPDIEAIADESSDKVLPDATQDSAAPTVGLLPEKTADHHTILLTLPLGDVSADDLVRIAEISDTYGVGSVRTTQRQGLLIPSVVEAQTDAALSELRSLSPRVQTDNPLRVVACAGASTCKLGLCLSRGLARAIGNRLSDHLSSAADPATIRISGCPNSCGHHYIGALGFQGRAKRVNGRLMPCYDVLAGAQTTEGGSNLAETVGTLPAKVIPEFVAELMQDGSLSRPVEQLREMVAKYSELPATIPDDYFVDWDADTPFSLAGRGPGECGAGVMDLIAVDIDEAKEALKQHLDAGKGHDDLYRAVVASARALLVTFGLEPKTDREVFSGFRQHMIEPGWAEPSTQNLLDSAMDWRMGEKDALVDLEAEVGSLVERIEQLFLSLDANLKFRLEPHKAQKRHDDSRGAGRQVDLRGVPCPLNFVKAKLELERIEVGDILEIQLDGGEPVQNVPDSFVQQGQEVLEVVEVADHFCVRVRRKK